MQLLLFTLNEYIGNYKVFKSFKFTFFNELNNKNLQKTLKTVQIYFKVNIINIVFQTELKL